MASTAMQTKIGENRKLPEFSFPPRYVSSQDPTPTQQTISKQPPSFGFPLHTIPRNPIPTPISMPEITSPLTPLSPTKPGTFLIIPLEIRLQIYHYVLLTHPIHHAHLAPLNLPTNFSGMNTEEFHTTMLRPSSSSSPLTSQEPLSRTLITKLASPSSTAQKINALYPISSPTTLATHPRVQGKIPTALLQSCRQVFEETKLIPWETNTFTFINWFWSGVYASRQFTRALRPWQSEAMRWVGVEVLARDLKIDGMAFTGGGTGGGNMREQGKIGEWWELCGLWRGVWGIKLGVRGAVKGEGDQIAGVDGSIGWNGEDGSSSSLTQDTDGRDGMEKEKEKGILDVRKEWVVDGLLQMQNLRWIELEIEDEDVDRDTKLRFCAELEEAFNSPSSSSTNGSVVEDQGERNVKVIFVERVKVEERPVSNADFVWYGGTAGNDSIWGLDM